MHDHDLEVAELRVAAECARAVAGVRQLVASPGRAGCRDCGAEIEPARRARHVRRPCITCGQPFYSEGAHHRMCTICRARANTVFHGVV